MTSTPSHSQPNPGISVTNPPRQKFRLNSIGTKLFVAVMAGALAGLGGISFLFYQTLAQQAERQVQDALKTEVNGIESQIAPVSQTAQNISVAIDSLKAAKVTDIEAYKSTVLGFYHQRPKLAMGTYFLQAPNAIIASRQWFGPYFYTDQKSPDQVGVALPAPHQGVIYSDLYVDDKYPTREYYTLPVKAERAVWTEPYIWYGITMTSFVRPNYDSQNKLTAVTGVDVNVSSLSKNIRGSVINNAGYFTLVSAKGTLMAYPPDPSKAAKVESYQKVPQLKAIWSKVQSGQSGLITVDGNLLAYRRVPSTNWLMLAVVPQSVVMLPVLGITLAGTLVAGAILAIVVALAARQINRRLQPILAECDKLAATDAQTQGKLRQEDEIGQLSLSFFNLLDTLSANQKQIQAEAEARLAETQERLRLATEAQKESEALQVEVGHILDVVSAVEDGDLTVEAEVSDRATGLVADTLNRLIEQLGQTLTQVFAAAQQVSEGSANLEELAKIVAANAEEQAQEVAQVLERTEQVKASAVSSLTQVHNSNQALLNVRSVVEAGQSSIDSMNQGIGVLQQGTDRIVQRMKTLGEFVGLADQFVQEQNQIASLTQVLALNATLVAARAAEQRDPRQFLVVAREFEAIAAQVSDLAQQTNDGLNGLQQRTTQIHSVVSAIDTEVQGLGSLVNSFTEGVDQSNQVFSSVQTTTSDVAKAGQAVAQSNQNIVKSAQATAQAMRGIADLAARTAQLTQTTQSQSEQMEALSKQLLNSIQFFRLPGTVPTVSQSSEAAAWINLASVDATTLDVDAAPDIDAPEVTVIPPVLSKS
ncbi:MAG: HAMP domain-containing protein [Aphanocapsa sp. GSE-SYN-MK-11-07L]|jgi:twitching motility protein PilJ|nr:HAMP domain-containing protein [Aphanocapsa sp. GSE-SYN-MK-11-07L]